MKAGKKLSIIILRLLILIFFVINANMVIAGPLNPDVTGTEQFDAFNTTAGFDSNARIGSIMATVIKAFLGLLGIIFIFLMVLAGYHWMTAAGDEQKITKAKDTIRTAIIGLIIIVAAYSITYFVLKALGGAGGPIGGGT